MGSLGTERSTRAAQGLGPEQSMAGALDWLIFGIFPQRNQVTVGLAQELFNETADPSLQNRKHKPFYPKMCLIEAAIKYPWECLLAKILHLLFFFSCFPHPCKDLSKMVQRGFSPRHFLAGRMKLCSHFPVRKSR